MDEKWATILSQMDKDNLPDAVRAKVATNYFNQEIMPSGLVRESPEIQAKVKANFFNTLSRSPEKQSFTREVIGGTLKGLGRNLAEVPREMLGLAETAGRFGTGFITYPLEVGARLGGIVGGVVGSELVPERRKSFETIKEKAEKQAQNVFGTGEPWFPETRRNLEYVGKYLNFPKSIAQWSSEQIQNAFPVVRELNEKAIPKNDWGKVLNYAVNEGTDILSAIMALGITGAAGRGGYTKLIEKPKPPGVDVQFKDAKKAREEEYLDALDESRTLQKTADARASFGPPLPTPGEPSPFLGVRPVSDIIDTPQIIDWSKVPYRKPGSPPWRPSPVGSGRPPGERPVDILTVPSHGKGIITPIVGAERVPEVELSKPMPTIGLPEQAATPSSMPAPLLLKPVTPLSETPSGGKQSWEMTREEYRKTWDTPEFRKKFPNYKGDQDHAVSVAEAVDTGKPVPSEVLADYPELQKTTELEKQQEERINPLARRKELEVGAPELKRAAAEGKKPWNETKKEFKVKAKEFETDYPGTIGAMKKDGQIYTAHEHHFLEPLGYSEKGSEPGLFVYFDKTELPKKPNDVNIVTPEMGEFVSLKELDASGGSLHKAIVKKHLSEITPEVLKDYPELKGATETGKVAPPDITKPWLMDESLWLREYEKIHNFTPGLGSHEGYVRQALVEGTLSPSDYNRLHADTYGPIEKFMLEVGTISAKDAAYKTRREALMNLTKIREAKPRSIEKRFGKNEPTPEQKIAYDAEVKDWNKRYSKANKVFKEADAAESRLAQSGKDTLARRIADASKEPVPDIAPIYELLGSDGKWRSPMSFPIGVKSTGEKRLAGYAYRNKEGQTFGQRGESEQALREKWMTSQDKKANDFYNELLNMPENRIKSQAEYWLKEPTSVSKPIGILRGKSKDSTGGWMDTETPVLSIDTPRNIKGQTSMGNWGVDYEIPSVLGKTGRQTRTEYFWRQADAVKWISDISKKKQSNLLSADRISDFRPGIDKVERQDNRTFVVDTEGQRAPLEVRSDKITPEIEANIRKTPPEKIAEYRSLTAQTPYLSPEGKAERLAIFDSLKKETVIPVSPKTEAAVTTPKEQKKYLVDKIDEAIPLASKEIPSRWKDTPSAIFEGKDYNIERTVALEANKTKFGTVTIQVPGDGEFTILNTQESLNQFKKKISVAFPVKEAVSEGITAPKLPSTKPTGKRITGEGVSYYNEFKPRQEGLIGQTKPSLNDEGKPITEQFYDGTYYSDANYIVKTPIPSKLFLVPKEEGPNLTKVIPKVKDTEPATIVGEYHFGNSENEPVLIHVISKSGKDINLDSKYVDSILSLHPKAKVFALKKGIGPVVFKIGENPVGVVMPIRAEGMPPEFADRIAEIKAEKDLTSEGPALASYSSIDDLFLKWENDGTVDKFIKYAKDKGKSIEEYLRDSGFDEKIVKTVATGIGRREAEKQTTPDLIETLVKKAPPVAPSPEVPGGTLSSTGYMYDTGIFGNIGDNLERLKTVSPKVVRDLKVNIDKWYGVPKHLADMYPQGKMVFEVENVRHERANWERTTHIEKITPFVQLTPKKSRALDAVIVKGDADGKIFTDPELTEMGLNDVQKKAYQSYREYYDWRWKDVLDTLEEGRIALYKDKPFYEELRKAIKTGKLPEVPDEGLYNAFNRLTEDLAPLQQMRQELGRVKGYMPRVRRRGQYAVTMEGENPYREQFQTLTFAKRKQRELQRQNPGQEVKIEPIKRTPETVFQSLNLSDMQWIIDKAIDNLKTGENASDAILLKLQNEVLREVADDIKSRGWGQRTIGRREGPVVKGYKEKNLKQILLEDMNGYIGWKTKYLAVQDYATALKHLGTDNPALFEYWSRFAKDMTRNSEFVDTVSAKARAVAFFSYLGASLKQVYLQSTQEAIMEIPELRKITSFPGVKAIKADINVSVWKRVSEEEKQFLSYARQVGWSEDSFVKEMMGKADAVFKGIGKNILDFVSWPISGMEIFNRESALLGSYRVFRQEKGMSPAEAAIAARDFTRTAHHTYGKLNLPGAMRSGGETAAALRAAYIFTTWSHQYVLWMKQNLSEKHFKTAMESLAWITILGGVASLPFLDNLVDYAEKKTGKPLRRDAIVKIREILGEKGAKAVMYGVPGLIGPGFDVSGSLGMGIPFYDLLSKDDSLESVFSVYTGVGQKTVRAGKLLSEGETGLATQQNPIVALGNVAKGIQGYRKGVTTWKGKPVLDYTKPSPEPFKYTLSEAIGKSVGFQPVRQSMAGKTTASYYNMKKYYSDLTENWGEQYARAYMKGDEKTQELIMNKIQKVNDLLANYGMEEFMINIIPIMRGFLSPVKKSYKFSEPLRNHQ